MYSVSICHLHNSANLRYDDSSYNGNDNLMDHYLISTMYFDCTHPSIADFAYKVLGDEQRDEIETAVLLYIAVRDGTSYNPYVFSTDVDTLSASYCLQSTDSYCIPKAVLLGTLARYKGIPSRLGLADVKNHISSHRLTDMLKTNIFVMHGYIELYLDGKWVKATPAFDAKLCKRIGVNVLEFDGLNDSVFQQYNLDGREEIEYVADHGTFEDVPRDFIFESLARAYPHLNNDEALQRFHQQKLLADLKKEKLLNS